MFTLNLSQVFYFLAAISHDNFSSTSPVLLASVFQTKFLLNVINKLQKPNPMNKSTNETANNNMAPNVADNVCTEALSKWKSTINYRQPKIYTHSKLRLIHTQKDVTRSSKVKTNMSGRFPPPTPHTGPLKSEPRSKIACECFWKSYMLKWEPALLLQHSFTPFNWDAEDPKPGEGGWLWGEEKKTRYPKV